MQLAGLRVERFVPAYDDGEIGPDTFHVIALAEAGVKVAVVYYQLTPEGGGVHTFTQSIHAALRAAERELAARVRLLRDRHAGGPAAGRDDDAGGQASPPRQKRTIHPAARRAGPARRAALRAADLVRALARRARRRPRLVRDQLRRGLRPAVHLHGLRRRARPPAVVPGGERQRAVGAAPLLLLALHPEGDARDRAERGRARPGGALLAHRARPLPAARPSDARVRARGARRARRRRATCSTATASASATCSIRRSSGRTRTTRRCSRRSRCSTASSSCWSAPTRASSSTTGGSRARLGVGDRVHFLGFVPPTSSSRSTGTRTRSPT